MLSSWLNAAWLLGVTAGDCHFCGALRGAQHPMQGLCVLQQLPQALTYHLCPHTPPIPPFCAPQELAVCVEEGVGQ